MSLYKNSLGTGIDHSVAQGTLFEMLVCVALDDKDDEVRLAAADALRCLPEADPDSCDSTCIARSLKSLSHQFSMAKELNVLQKLLKMIDSE